MLIVSNDLREGTGGSTSDLLHNVTEVVDEEVECLSAVGDRAEETVDSANDFSNKTGDVVDEANEQRVQVKRFEDALHNVDEMAQTYDKLQVGVDVRNGDVDLLHGDLHTRVDSHETSNFGIQIDVGLQLLDIEFDASNVQFRDVQVHIWGC